MSCKQIPFATLMRLADGELRGLKALTVRRHIKRCADCRQTLSELGRVDFLLQSADYFPAEAKHKTIPLRPIGLVSGVALAAGAALFFVMPGGVVRPTVSFASVEEAMSKIHTVHWTETINGRTTESWGQTNPPRLMRFEMANRYARRLLVCDEQYEWRIICYFDKNGVNTYTKIPHSGLYRSGEGKASNRIQAQILLPEARGNYEYLKKMPGIKVHVSPWQKTQEVLQNKPVTKFIQTLDWQESTETHKQILTFWVDSQTMRVIRRELLIPALGAGRTPFRSVAENFRYNEKLPSSTFDVPKPRVGQRYYFSELCEPSQEREAAGERFTVVRQALQAFQNKDSKAFLALWDLDALPEAQILLARRGEYQTWKLDDVREIPDNVFSFVHEHDSDPIPPQQQTSTMQVLIQVKVWVTTAQTRTPYLAPATFTLTKRSGQWKIQELNLSTRPLDSKSPTKK